MSTFTKKNYEVVAEVIRKHFSDNLEATRTAASRKDKERFSAKGFEVLAIQESFITAFKKDNSRFNEEAFLKTTCPEAYGK